MWPLLLDMTKEESMQSLRCLELEAYASLVSALRAQGPLNTEKMKLLKETSVVLNISQDRHKAEIRRAVNDEKLNTIAYHVSGQKITSDEWTQEGRRLIPLMPRVAPQTAYSAIADEAADTASKNNKLLPNPSSTERKRPASMCGSGIADINKSMSFRMPEPPKSDDAKKRKLSLPMEGSSLAQHLMGPPKMSKIQQIYRQKTKARQKELQLKIKQDQEKTEASSAQQKIHQQQPPQQKIPPTNQSGSPKVNIIQNISIPTPEGENNETTPEPTDVSACKVSESNNVSPQPGCTNENLAPKIKPMISCPKLNQHITLKHVTSSSPNGEKQIKVSGARKNVTTKCITSGQKLIVVSNPQSITTSSILQRTLTIPFVKNISVKNFDKFKIVTTNTSSNIQLTPLATSGAGAAGKHKVVTVRTNPTVKKVIPLSQLQVLNAKGSIKVLPLGGKIVTKPNTSSTPVYIVNSGNMQCITKSTTSTPIIMTCKAQENLDNKSLLVLKNPEPANAKDADLSQHPEDFQVKEEIQDDNKSNVLADIMEAVGVVPLDSENLGDVRIKSEQEANNSAVTQAVAMNVELDAVKEEKTDLDDGEMIVENINAADISVTNDTFTYVSEKKTVEEGVQDIKIDETYADPGNGAGTLDPTTGFYTLPSLDNAACESLNVECRKTITTESIEHTLND